MSPTVLVIDGNGKRGIFSYYMSECLQANGFRPDLIVGVSSGALVGALLASGKVGHIPESQMIQLGETIRTTGERRIPWWTAMVPGHHKTNLIRSIFKDMLLKDVDIPLHILVDGVGDIPRIFSSTNKVDGEIELYRILDATTAIPAVFPSVDIAGKHYVDALLIATSPKTIAYFIALNAFGTSDFRMISMGARLDGSLSPTLSDSSHFKQCDGILDHFRHGLVSKMIWRRDALMESLVRESLKNRFLRLEAVIDIDNRGSFQSIHDHCKEKAKCACIDYDTFMEK
jgi:hypothetical protein